MLKIQKKIVGCFWNEFKCMQTKIFKVFNSFILIIFKKFKIFYNFICKELCAVGGFLNLFKIDVKARNKPQYNFVIIFVSQFICGE